MPEPHPLEGNRAIATIQATHQCFNDAMAILGDFLLDKQVPPHELRLVHAICLFEDNTRYAHAWVERTLPAGVACYFLGFYDGVTVICTVPRPAYYARLRVQERTKYTPWQAARENQRTVSYGPWKPQYLALCHNIQETR